MAYLELLKNPYEISFSGNPLQFIWQVAPYGNTEKAWEITAVVRVMVEQVYNSNFFSEVYVQKLYPDDTGKIQIDVASIIDAYLDYYTPKTDLQKPVECIGQRKRYQVNVTYQGPDIPDLPPMGPDPEIYYAVKGGMAKEAWHYKEFFTKIISLDKKPLLFSAAKELVDPAALKFLYWIYPFADLAEQTITYKIYFSDGTTATKNNATKITSGKWSVNCVPAGFSQAGLDALVPADKSVIKYSIKITTATATIVEEYFFIPDNRNFYDQYFLLYRNSIGGLETVRLLGQVDLAAEYTRQQARRTTAPDWFGVAKAHITDENTEETFSYTADTGFMSKEQLLKLRDLFLSKEKYQLFNGRLLPIALTTSKTKFFSNKDNLVSTQIEWQQAFINSFFTPGTLMPPTRSCPAVEKLFATQLNKNTLLIMWALEDPYDQVEVQITIEADTFIYTYTGNTGSVVQSFVPPAIIDFVNISVKARTICNADSVPVDYGQFSEVTVSLHPNSLPVAVDDNYQVPLGFTGVLPFSVLDNDYDPDGDPIEAFVDWGLFGVGSSPAVFSIDKAGFVTISSSSGLTGPQTFNYRIHEIGSDTYVKGKVNITFGNGPQSVFVKWVMRNITQDSPESTSAEGWLDYYSDPACTIPLDITALGLTINAKWEATGSQTGSKNYSFLGTGTKVLLWEKAGIKNTNSFYHFEIIFTVLPGAGYTAVNP